MAKFRLFGMKEADAIIQNAENAINPLLTAAKITTIEVNGKPLAATSDEVPIELKIAAYAGVAQSGAKDNEISQVLANNTVLAEQAKTLNERAVTAETTVGALTREKTALQSQLDVANANVATLTASVAELTNLRKAANDEAGRLTGQLNALNTELSRRCLALDCLVDLRGKNNELLVSTASKEDRLAAAEKIPAADKLNALCGAVNSTIARVTGLDPNKIPTSTSALANLIAGTPRILEQYNAITNAADKVAFYRKHSAEIDAAHKSSQATS